MRSTLAMATFAALAASAAGVSALDANPHMFGSDTLKKLTTKILVQCGANCAGLVYDGTGSGAGQTALLGAAQSVAPMSRALNSGICADPGRTTAEGIVLALDGVNIVGDNGNAGSVACNGNPGTSFDSTTGLSFTGGTTWRDQLRLVYAGMPAGTSTDPLARDCNSAARVALVNNWNDLFKGDCANCTDSNPDATVTEPGLRHAFRRDEESGTTDVFLGLLSLGTINFGQNEPAGTGTAAYSADTRYSYRAIANSPFCNVHRPNDMYWAVTVPANKTVAQVLAGTAKLIPPLVDIGTVPTGQLATAQGVNGHLWSVIADTGPFDGADDVTFPESQDQDPIRRHCVGDNFDSLSPGQVTPSEQVCSADGQLGLVLAINPPPATEVQTVFPNVSCDAGSFAFTFSVQNSVGQGIRCPNGDETLGAPAKCRTPQDADGKFNCLNGGGAWIDVDPATPGIQLGLAANGGPSVIDGTTPGLTKGRADVDGRVYNLILRDAAGHPQNISRPTTTPGISAPTPIVGAFYRIHSTRSLVGTGGTKTCTASDATTQVGCLVQASPCSLGYAGGEAVSLNPGTVGLRVNGVLPTIPNIQCLVQTGCDLYPFSRKLYVNTLTGFDKPKLAAGATVATDHELAFVRAATIMTLPIDSVGARYSVYGPLAAAGPHVNPSPTPPYLYGDAVASSSSFGFVQLPPSSAASIAGEPFCEDFNENTCGATNGCTTDAGTGVVTCPANVNACRAALHVAGIPDNAAFCGDGIKQPGEACDDGNTITDARNVAGGDVANDTCSSVCATTP